MSVHSFSPEQMFQPVPYHHVAVGTGMRHVHVAGQIARDGHGNAIAVGDMSGQVAQVLRSTKLGLTSAGATFADVVRLRFFITESQPDTLRDFMAGIESVTKELELPQPLPPVSVIGVSFLFEPDVLVELEAYAVLR